MKAFAYARDPFCLTACALYLASPAADYVTGEIYGVNGGLTQLQTDMPRAALGG